MNTMESLFLSYLANVVWQAPLLFAAGWLATRVVSSLGVRAEHHVWIGVLLLQGSLPALSTIPASEIHTWITFFRGSQDVESYVSIVMGPGTALVNPHVPAWLLAALAIAYCGITTWFVARFMWRLRSLHLLSRNALEAPLPGDLEEYWAQCQEMFNVKEASLSTSSEVFGPITIGVRRKRMLIPPAMLGSLPETELKTAVAHEFAHMQRDDFFKNLLYELWSLPISFHPILTVTRDRIRETREMVCDELAAGISDRPTYARSLLRLASLLVGGMPAEAQHIIGIFDATTFERRIMRLTEKLHRATAMRRFTSAATCTLLGASICIAGLGFSVHFDALAATDEPHPSNSTGPVPVRAETMRNQIVHKTPPVYPVEAKRARIQGKVQLDAVIGKAGEIEQLKVISGPQELQQAAIDAVRQWTYRPFLLNGDPVDVKTTIDVHFRLAGPAGSKPSHE